MDILEHRPEGLIFDFDGTLADTFPLIIAAWNEAVREPLGRTFTPEEVIALFGVPEAEMLRRAVSEPEWERAVETFHAQYEALHGMLEPFEGVTCLLEAAHAAGCPMGVVSGKGRRSMEITLRLLGWERFFGSVVTGDDVTRQKPDPEGPFRAARELAVEPGRCVFIGDNPFDVEAGRAAGMATIAAGWHAQYTDALRAAAPDYWADTPADCRILLGLG